MKPSDTRSLSGHSTDEEFDDEWESIVGMRRQAEDRAQQSVMRGVPITRAAGEEPQAQMEGNIETK